MIQLLPRALFLELPRTPSLMDSSSPPSLMDSSSPPSVRNSKVTDTCASTQVKPGSGALRPQHPRRLRRVFSWRRSVSAPQDGHLGIKRDLWGGLRTAGNRLKQTGGLESSSCLLLLLILTQSALERCRQRRGADQLTPQPLSV